MKSLLFSILILSLITVQAFPQIPRTISYQGLLCDAAGKPKPDNTYQITFRLYEAVTGGTAIWTDVKTLPVRRGLFSALLGPLDPTITFDKPCWLGIQVESEGELSPRIPLSSVGYSFNSVNADTADYAASIKDGAVTVGKVASGQIVKSINALKDDVTLASGTNVTITPSGNVLTIAATGGGTLSLPYTGITSSSSPAFSMTNSGLGQGIFGESSGGVGVRGESSAGIGVGGKSTSGIGVGGQTTSNSGVYGSSVSGDGVGGESSSGRGVYGKSTSGSGVHGTNLTTGNYGELGSNDYGIHAVAFGSAIGLFAKSAVEDGVRGESSGSNKSGVYGVNDQGDGYGVFGRNSFNGNVGYLGGQDAVYGSTDVAFAAAAVRGVSTANGGTGLWGQADVGSNAWGVHGYSAQGIAIHGSTTSGIGMYCDGKFYQTGGGFEAHPTSTTWSTNKPATVKLANGSKAKLFAEEAAEVYFTDYGEAVLTNGKAHVELDPRFLQTVTVDAGHPLRAFVQVNDDCKGVFVANRTATGFDVLELHNGASNAHFTYRVVCKRRYYEDERLATDEEDLEYNTRMLQTVWPEVIAQQQTQRELMKVRERPLGTSKPGGAR